MTVNRFPEFVGEAECAKLTSALARIARALVDRHAGFLFGAGMSAPAPSNVPTGKSLASKLLSRFFENRSVSPEQLQHLAETVPFECIAQAVENLPGKKRADLTAYLTELMFESDPPINESHKKFLSVYNWGGEPRLRRIYTTNFDKLLEKAFAVRGVTVTERNANEIDTIEAQDRVPVLHLHGVLDEE